jgi:hypothetical protein
MSLLVFLLTVLPARADDAENCRWYARGAAANVAAEARENWQLARPCDTRETDSVLGRLGGFAVEAQTISNRFLATEQAREIQELQRRVAATFPASSPAAEMVSRTRFVQFDQQEFCEATPAMREDPLCSHVAQVTYDGTVFIDRRLAELTGVMDLRLVVAHELGHHFDRVENMGMDDCYHFLTDATGILLLRRAGIELDPRRLTPHIGGYLRHLDEKKRGMGRDPLCRGRSRIWYIENCSAQIR